jgi:hypothetical protein
MARDYLSIPGTRSLNLFARRLLFHYLATSIDVERTFSQGRLLLSHVRSRLSIHSTRALLCLGTWSALDLVKDSDIRVCLTRDEIGKDEGDLAEDWDIIAAI